MIKLNIHSLRRLVIFILFMLLFLSPFNYPHLSRAAEYPILKKYIIEYNLDTLAKSLKDNSYRGEEGILMINPDVANSLGIKTVMHQDYLDSKNLFKEAKKALGNANNAMAAQKEMSSGYYAEIIADNFLLYKKLLEDAEKKLMNYRSSLHPETDERFDNTICEGVLDNILEKSLIKTGYKLRDGLADFYNTCQGVSEGSFPLTTENVGFVNYVFNAFLEHASEEEIKVFDLDRDDRYGKKRLLDSWKDVAGQRMSEFATTLEKAINKIGNEIYEVDPVLFIALIKKESDFDPLAVSGVGAAGLTQIMPGTGKDMGLEYIHIPDYYNEAGDVLKKERDARRSATAALFKITEKEKIKYAKKAREFMQESLDLGRKRKDLYNRYRKDLIEKKSDARLEPAKAIEYGLIYFARQMKAQHGDISLALASYNAGPHRIKEYKGIPPYKETIGFRNRILKYYQDYLLKIGEK